MILCSEGPVENEATAKALNGKECNVRTSIMPIFAVM